MSEHLLLGLSSVVVLGVGAQWLAWRLGLPSILLLLAIGFLAGPVSGTFLSKPLLDPDHLLGELLLPIVSISVALILYEGGLTLRLTELGGAGTVVWRLVSVGAMLTWVIAAAAARMLLEMPWPLAILLGAVLVVTGPTVILPLLREIRPSKRVAAVLKWEGIVIDPIGALLAVLVFEVILLADVSEAAPHIFMAILRTVVIGGGLGLVAGIALALLLRAFLIPDFLQNAVSLMLVIAVHTAAQLIQSESGLFAATIMGVTLANQRLADVRHIVEFKENLRVLLVSALFVLLAARVKIETLETIGPAAWWYLLALIALARPVSVLASSVGTALNWRERALLAVMSPRGIVAASVAAVFALRLQQQGMTEAGVLVPMTFLVIIGTVLFSGLAAPIAARQLGLAERHPQGVLFVGAHEWTRAVADLLRQSGFRVLLVDTNRENLTAARLAGIEIHEGSILADKLMDEIDLNGIGRLVAATPNNWVNVLASSRFARIFNRSEVYQVGVLAKSSVDPHDDHQRFFGRKLFGKQVTLSNLTDRMRRGARVKATPLTAEFTFKHFQQTYGGNALPMFVITESKKLQVITDDMKLDPKPGQTLVSLVDQSEAEPVGSDHDSKSDDRRAVST